MKVGREQGKVLALRMAADPGSIPGTACGSSVRRQGSVLSTEGRGAPKEPELPLLLIPAPARFCPRGEAL